MIDIAVLMRGVSVIQHTKKGLLKGHRMDILGIDNGLKSLSGVGNYTVSTANMKGRLQPLSWWRGRRKPQ
jgi:hypothetical protein